MRFTRAHGLSNTFQSTPPRGRRRLLDELRHLAHQFQSTPPRGRRLVRGGSRAVCPAFQSTPPRGRRLTNEIGDEYPGEFQSTPPRGRRPHGILKRSNKSAVSIHASAWEATPLLPLLILVLLVSIHASAWEATKMHENACARCWRFNPRLRVGGDALGFAGFYGIGRFQSTPPRGRRRKESVEADKAVIVSIHASAWEATRPAAS